MSRLCGNTDGTFWLLVIAAIFDMIVGWKVADALLEFLKSRDTGSTGYWMAMTCIQCSFVQCAMGIVLLAATIKKSLFVLRFYVYVTAVTFLATVPSVLRAFEFVLINQYMKETMNEARLSQDYMNAGNLNQVVRLDTSNTGRLENRNSVSGRRETTASDLERQASAADVRYVHTMFLEEQQPNVLMSTDGTGFVRKCAVPPSAPVESPTFELIRFQTNSTQNAQRILPTRSNAHPLRPLVLPSLTSAPPPYSICIPTIDRQDKADVEDSPPSYNDALEMSELTTRL